MPESLLIAALVLLGVVALLLIAVILRQGSLERRVLERVERLQEADQAGQRSLREEVGGAMRGMSEQQVRTLEALGNAQNLRLQAIADEVAKLGSANEKRLEALRTTVDGKLKELQLDNTAKLERIRETVDQKLQGVLEKRLAESFKSVSERLEQVHRGLGEMQGLAQGVGDLKRVLTNVKTRGTWGEVQLGNLLEQVLTPEQFETNVAVKPRSPQRVEFAIKLPGREDGDGQVWLPIDSKFPQEDWLRLVEASEAVDASGIEEAGRALEVSVRTSAREIRDKYISPPHTTNFGILFLPTEGLYAEIIRRTGLVEQLQRECSVVVAGPTVLSALLNSLQMGFRTLAIEKRSNEVWKVLGGVKTEFGKFGETLARVKEKLDQASKDLEEKVAVRTRQIERRLDKVGELPAAQAPALLIDALEADGADDLEA
jgi:DNA recombination protein RmuC